ncbi:MAG TPA: nucleotidyltransferase family protein, partial [Longimicrobiales bacterium]|nr:nucleotidyltransferase family protein [Longimicrobiales bacterium]
MATHLLLSLLGTETQARRIAGRMTADEWQSLFDEAVYHELEPILHWRFEQIGVVLPDAVRRLLEERTGVHALRSRLLLVELGDLLRALAGAGVPVILLKGAALAAGVYPDPALRSMGDIDLLVRERDLPRARDAAIRLGYRPEGEAAEHHLPPLRRPGATMVELHSHIESPSAPFRIDTEGLWERAQTIRTADCEARTLCAEDLLLHLCLHLSYHHRFGLGRAEGMDLKHLYDIVVLLERGSINWGIAAARAREWRADRYVYVVLRVVQRLFGTRVSADVMALFGHSPADVRVANHVSASVLHRPDTAARQYRKLRNHGSAREGIAYLRSVYRAEYEAAHDGQQRMSTLRAVLGLSGRLMRRLPAYARAAAGLMLGTRRARAAGVRMNAREAVAAWIR